MAKTAPKRTNMVARIRVTIDAPFKADVEELSIDLFADETTGRERLADRAAHAEKVEEISKQREEAARHVEKEIRSAIEARLRSLGAVVDYTVEEVRDA